MYRDWFDLADRCRRPLGELMGWPPVVTDRQLLAWAAWRADDMEHPGKTEVYLMSVAREVRQLTAWYVAAHTSNKRVEPVQLDDLRLTRDRPGPTPTRVMGQRPPTTDPALATAWSKGRLLTLLKNSPPIPGRD